MNQTYSPPAPPTSRLIPSPLMGEGKGGGEGSTSTPHPNPPPQGGRGTKVRADRRVGRAEPCDGRVRARLRAERPDHRRVGVRRRCSSARSRPARGSGRSTTNTACRCRRPFSMPRSGSPTTSAPACSCRSCVLSALALGLMRFAARLRGRPDWADVFFPVSLLHLGHWENFILGYQICFALFTVLVTGSGRGGPAGDARNRVPVRGPRRRARCPAARA